MSFAMRDYFCVREEPPSWPRGKRGLRPRHCTITHEPFAGALVLSDLRAGQEETESLRILARYVVYRFVHGTTEGTMAPARLEAERAVVWEQLDAAQHALCAEERASLRALARSADRMPAGEMARFLFDSADAALRDGHRSTAAGALRLAYRVALRAGAGGSALEAAERTLRLAREDGAGRAIAVWAERIRRLRPE